MYAIRCNLICLSFKKINLIRYAALKVHQRRALGTGYGDTTKEIGMTSVE